MLLYPRVNGEILHRVTLYKSKYTIFDLQLTTIVQPFSWQITKRKAGPASALESMIGKQSSRCCLCKDWSTLHTVSEKGFVLIS